MLTQLTSSEMQIDQFNQALCKVFGAFQTDAAESRQTVRGAVHAETRAGFDVAHIANDLQTIRRTQVEILRDQGTNIFLIVQEEGQTLMAQRKTVRILRPGDMILIDSAVPAEFTFFGRLGRQLSIHMPRADLVARIGDVDFAGCHLPRTHAITLAMRATLAKAFQAETNAHQSQFLHEVLINLVGAWVHEAQDHRVADVEAEIGRAKVLQIGLAYLDRMFKDGSLTIQKVADDLKVSIRQLQRAFELIGVTPIDYLQQRRLEYACQLLLDRKSGKLEALVSTIAYQSGFNDVSYFNRQFRKHFGCSPSRYGQDRLTA
ncbi:helix-turn-helix domain-containing protein [Cognatishimia sp. SS12]|uniref:helix-turn-helix domain-containing protein n=1 Tax=Cognatishimia sp. SS12 TaxID=2979465 RepID=UPI00232D5FC4|nr:helix-turn-helix domain-containing protein [Cognatishimia sp. SS12]MDC0739327.1 helix-turn-helix domain-containing protein [Cognatishimia sp. SS12]